MSGDDTVGWRGLPAAGAATVARLRMQKRVIEVLLRCERRWAAQPTNVDVAHPQWTREAVQQRCMARALRGQGWA